jgi:hypothetical protein
VAAIIARKTEGLLSDCNAETHRVLTGARARARWLSSPASATPQIASDSVVLVVTSAPIPGATDYAEENWPRCWFIGVDARSLKLTAAKEWEDWRHAMLAVFRELHRVLRAGGYVALDAGGFRNRKLELEYAALPCGVEAGLRPELVLINEQKLSATSRCWGLGDSAMSISTDRVVLFRKPP